MKKAENIKCFKSLKQKSLFAIHDPVRLKFSHLNEHEFCHHCKDPLIPMCDCDCVSLRCPFFEINRQKLLNDLIKIDLSSRSLKDELLLEITYMVLASIRTLLTRKYSSYN